MSTPRQTDVPHNPPTVLATIDEGGLRPPDDVRGLARVWWWFHFLILIKLARLRFIAILVVIGVVITQWDLLVAHYERWTRPPAAAEASDPDIEYYCPMHPTIVRDNNREKCPLCFMPLAKRRKATSDSEVLPAGTVNRVQLSPYRVLLAGVATVPVQRLALSRRITATGTVEFNERGQRIVSARVAGRIDKLLVNTTGAIVEQNQELAQFYSPDLVVTIDNLLQAHKRGNEALVASARQRLSLWGLGDDQIDAILRGAGDATHQAVRSPIAGHVIQKFVKEGQYVEVGMPLYELADLSTVWIEAQIYEDDMALLPLDQNHQLHPDDVAAIRVTAHVRTMPGKEFEGRLAFVYPHLDQDSRTVTVRIELDNPRHELRPGSTASVNLDVPLERVPIFADPAAVLPDGQPVLRDGQVLAIPESSVIDTGMQQIVYRQAGPGVFEGRQVALGPKMKSPDGITYFPVLGGLTEGETIVTSGSFLIDAETRLNPAAGSIYSGGSRSEKEHERAAEAVRPSTPDHPDARLKAALAKLSPADRRIVDAQRFCPIVPTNPLGSMGPPYKLTLRGETIFVCCEGCRDQALADPEGTLFKVRQLRKAAPTTR